MIANAINELCRLNARIEPSPVHTGLRQHDVFCVAKTGQKIRFTQPQNIAGQLSLILEKFDELYSEALELKSLSFALAYFWFGFIAVHPFANANGRTGKAYLLDKIKFKGMKLKDPEKLQAILLKGDTTEDLKQLTQYFYTHLEPRT
ncbi:MAG: Fic family protein [Bacteriovoracaceae bacterium]|nr:Fic family protein [Bacteriovoracaceae bacterium]